MDSEGRTIWIVDAHRDNGKRFIVRSDQKLAAFLELEGITHELAVSALLGDDTHSDQGRGRPSHRIGLNAVLLHLGHRPAASNGTGRVVGLAASRLGHVRGQALVLPAAICSASVSIFALQHRNEYP